MTTPSPSPLIFSYEDINSDYCRAKYGDFDVIMMKSNGYINATKLCTDGGKEFKHWLANKGNKALIDCYQKELIPAVEISTAGIMIMKTTGSSKETILRGTYVNRYLITHIASWVSPTFALKVSKIVDRHLMREKEEELHMERIRRGEACKERDILQEKLDKVILQNEQLLAKNDKVLYKLKDTKSTLKRVEDRVDTIVKHVVPPAEQAALHEQFGIMRLNQPGHQWQYKVYRAQKRCVRMSKIAIVAQFPKAKLVHEVKPHPNAKNFLHLLKEKYGGQKLEIKYNYITLLGDATEDELLEYINEVVEESLNYGSDE